MVCKRVGQCVPTAPAQAKLIYDAIEGSQGFYASPVDPAARSAMNIPFTIPSNPDLEKAFIAEATKLGMVRSRRSAHETPLIFMYAAVSWALISWLDVSCASGGPALHSAVCACTCTHRLHVHAAMHVAKIKMLVLPNVDWQQQQHETSPASCPGCCHAQVQLKGHRSVGGMRASVYNSMPMAGARALATFMQACSVSVLSHGMHALSLACMHTVP